MSPEPETKIAVRPLRSDDLEAVKILEIECRLSPWTAEDYQKELLRPDALLLAAEYEGRLAGFLISRLIMTRILTTSSSKDFLSLSARTMASEPSGFAERTKPAAAAGEFYAEGEIYNIGVRESLRKHGIGSLLLERYFLTGRSCNLVKTSLEVRKSNESAIAFYLKNNFRIAGLRKNFYTHPGEDALVLCREEKF